MTTAVFLVDAIISHTYSSMGLARRLQQRGIHVEYWGVLRNGMDHTVESQGFVFRPLEGMWSRFSDDIRVPTDLRWFNLPRHIPSLIGRFRRRRQRLAELPHALEQFERALDRRLAETRPAFAVLDSFAIAYYPLLHARGIPAVVLSTKPLPIPDPLVPPYDSSLMPRDTLGGRTLVRLAWCVRRFKHGLMRTMRAFVHLCGGYSYHQVAIQLAARTGFPLREELVPRWLQPDLNFKSLHEWALWTPETDLPRRGTLPAHARYIGPHVDRERRQAAVPWEAKRAGHKVYVAVGTVRFRWKDNASFLRKAVAAFGDVEGVEVVISTGDERATRALGTVPANIRVYDFVPQLRMLEDADLVVTHAGAGTYRECVETLVPMLAYPRNHDQIGNAVRIAFHGIGLRGDRHRDSPATIRRKALTILSDPSFRQNLVRLRDSTHRSEHTLLTVALEAFGITAAPAAAIAPDASDLVAAAGTMRTGPRPGLETRGAERAS